MKLLFVEVNEMNGFVEFLMYALIMAFICALPATPVFCYLRKVFYVPLARKKMMEKAVADGHIVKAKIDKSNMIVGGSEYTLPTGEYRVTYRYEYAGKEYKYRGMCTGRPDDEVTLYFEKKPNLACSYYELGYRESNWHRYYWWMVLICFAVVLIYEVSKYLS